MDKVKIINTNKSTYEEYVKQGLWKPLGDVKYNVGNSGKVDADVQVKGRFVKFIPALIIISDYFYDPKNVRRG